MVVASYTAEVLKLQAKFLTFFAFLYNNDIFMSAIMVEVNSSTLAFALDGIALVGYYTPVPCTLL